METIKSFERFFDPDPRSPSLGPRLEKQYEILSAYCHLHNGVPEDVRSYFDMVLTLYLYGWLYYPFYTLAAFLSTFVVEMALRERLPKKLDRRSRDRRGLGELLKEAKEAGLLRDEGFPHVERAAAYEEEMARELAEIVSRTPKPQARVPYTDRLIGALPYLRNRFAHPDIHLIMPPGPALDSLIVAAEIINQLWPGPASV